MEKTINVSLGIKKGKTGKAYCYAYVDLGYREATLTFDKSIIAEIFEINIKDLYELLEEYEKNHKEG